MKFIKKLLLLGAALSVCIGMSATAIACGKTLVPPSQGSSSDAPSTDSSEALPDDDNLAYIHRVSVQNATGFGYGGLTSSQVITKLADEYRAETRSREQEGGREKARLEESDSVLL